MNTESCRGLRSKIVIYDDYLFDDTDFSFITLPVKREEYKGVYDVQDN